MINRQEAGVPAGFAAIPRRRSWRVGAGTLAVLLVVCVGGSLIQATTTLGGAFPAANGKLAYTSYQDGNTDVYTRNSDGSSETRLTTDTNIDTHPAVSADGSKVLYATKQGGGAFEVYSMSTDGSGKTNLSNHSNSDYEPTWSPDGTKIAFTSDRSGDIDVWVMNADGTGAQNLTSGAAGEDQEPTWSPDGTQIAFTSKRAGNFDVWVMNADGTNPVNLTGSASSEDQWPTWSPDGTMIAFASKRSGNFDVWVMNANGSSPANYTSGNYQEDHAPDWGGLPGAPTFSTTSPPSPANDNDPEILGSAPAGTTVRLYTDAACSSPVAATGGASEFASPGLTVSVADDSTTSFYATAANAGGTSPCSASSVTYTEDSTSPETIMSDGPSGPTGDSSPTFSFESGETGSTFECRVDAGAWVACTSPHTSAPLADGPHTFEVRAVDAAGNVDQTPASATFAVDTVAPETTIGSGPSGATDDSTPTFSFESSETGSTFECRVDAGAWVACTSPHTTAPLADGPHTFEVRAVDAAGNADQTPASVTFTVDMVVTGPQPGGSQPGGGQAGGERKVAPGREDLGTIPGNLAAASRCQRLSRPVRNRSVLVPRVGTVHLGLRAGAFVTPTKPARVTVSGPTALRTVRWVLNGGRPRQVAGAPFKLSLGPAALSSTSRNVLAIRLAPRRGKAKQVKLRMSTVPCRTVFVAAQRRRRDGGRLKLRVDSVRALSRITFKVPSRLLPARVANKPVGRLTLRTASGGRKSYRLSPSKSGRYLLKTAGAPLVLVRRGQIQVSRLPAGAGIVGLYLNNRVSTTRRVKLRARVVGAEGAEILSVSLRGARRR